MLTMTIPLDSTFTIPLCKNLEAVNIVSGRTAVTYSFIRNKFF